MSYLSTSGNVGFSGIPQSMSDASCATQYKMAVDGVPGVVNGDVTLYPNDISNDEQNYLPHVDYYHSKFKIDADELYTFHDSDIIANEITVPHTEDNFVYNDNIVEFREDENSKEDYDFIDRLSNGLNKEEHKEDFIPNGHYKSTTKNIAYKIDSNYKVVKAQNHIKKDVVRRNSANEKLKPSGGKVGLSKSITTDTNCSINSVNHVNNVSSNKTGSETFLDVFKREQMGLKEDKKNDKLSPPSSKSSSHTSRKSSSKSSSKSRRGRGPALHEALQRIHSQKKVVVIPNSSWHAPGEHLFEYGPLIEKKYPPFHQYELAKAGSEDEEVHLNFDIWQGCIEESSMEDRESRLAMRRAALRRQVALVSNTTKLQTDYKSQRSMVSTLKKQFHKGEGGQRLSPHIVNQLLAERGMNSLIGTHERRKLREKGWSGGESIASQYQTDRCMEENCENPTLPCAKYCLAHITTAADQQLYASCAAVFAGGTRCKQALLPLHDQTPLCAEHAWKRDNYNKVSRDCKPKKVVRKRVYSTSPRRAKRRRRPPVKLRLPPNVPSNTQTLTELNVCSNSSYDSSEDTGIGGLSENEYSMLPNIPTNMGTPSATLEVCEVGQVSADDILDPAVLSQIPDEAFTEFFNQCESDGPASFVESEELTRALEAVLDERALDLADCIFTPPQHTPRKISVPTSVTMEVSSVAPS